MKKQVAILIAVVVVILVGVYFLFFQRNETGEEGRNPVGGNSVESLTKQQTESYTANIINEEDQSILNVQTNLIEEKFKFSYDTQNFVLDTSSKLFDDAEIIIDTEKENRCEVSINLDSNEVYKIYFIKKSNTDMFLGKTLEIK